jgi:hypothetical protein
MGRVARVGLRWDRSAGAMVSCSAAARPEGQVYRTLIFYRSEPPSLSPAISIWWPGRVIDLFNLVPPNVWGNGNLPEGRCG